MGERYAKCERCKGMGSVIVDKTQIECMSCDGSGFTGDAYVYYQKEIDKDWEQQKPDDFYRVGRDLGDVE